MLETDNLRYTKIALNNGSGAIPALDLVTSAASICSKVTSATAVEDAEPVGASLMAASGSVPEAPASIQSSISFTWSGDKGRFPCLGMKSSWSGGNVILRKRSLPCAFPARTTGPSFPPRSSNL